MNRNATLYLALVLIGALWGMTFPITKTAVSTGHLPLGIMVWQQVGTMVLTGVVTVLRAKSLRLRREHIWLFVGIALLGYVFPGYFSYLAARHIPAGVLAIIIALVPMTALPVALLMRYETFSRTRLLGLLLGAAAVVVLVAPSSTLLDPAKAVFVLLAVLATILYGLEANFLEWFNRLKLKNLPDPFQALFGANVFALSLTLPPALIFGHNINPLTPWGAPEWSMAAISLLSTLAYSGYIWLIGRTGPVFAAQVAYLITGFGVLWSILLLDENYSAWIWLALALIMAGVFLVRPRKRVTNT